jgi:hypothetical protein
VSIVRWNLKEVRTAKRCTEEHISAHMRHLCGARGLKSLKPDTDTEHINVDATVISVKEVCMYPGRSHFIFERGTSFFFRYEKSAAGKVGLFNQISKAQTLRVYRGHFNLE